MSPGIYIAGDLLSLIIVFACRDLRLSIVRARSLREIQSK